jgi:hypothetical protein
MAASHCVGIAPTTEKQQDGGDSMAVTIPDNFCGYVEIDSNRYAYSVNGHFVKLLPAFEGKEEQGQEQIIELTLRKASNQEDCRYIYGYDESEHLIALFQSSEFLCSRIGASFFAPIIIKSNGNLCGFYSNLTKDWKQYDAIMFSGGIIDSLYNPKIAALKMPTLEEQMAYSANYDGARSIEIKPFIDYTLNTSIEIDGQKAKLVLSVSQVGEGNINTTGLGSLKSFIQLQFETPQDFITIRRYTRIINAMLAVFARQGNINFDVNIKQKTKSDKFMGTGICKVFVDNEDFYKPQSHQIVPMQSLFDYLPQIIKIVARGEAETILALLPKRNKDRNGITITNVQDLCTALEAEYNLSSSKTPTSKDTAIQLLKEGIKTTIKNFAAENDFIDPNKETTIGSCFNYLELNLKSKIFALYGQHKASIDGIRQKHHLPEMTIENISKFVKLRNTRVHTGKIVWGDSAELYTSLMALLYSCFFARAGVPNETIASILPRIF